MEIISRTIPLKQFKEACSKEMEIGRIRFNPKRLTRQILEDISSVKFEMENFTIGNADIYPERSPNKPQGHIGFNGYPCGYVRLPNGVPVLFVNAGGDWECPVCFCIYHDGNKLRGYVPIEGNVFDKSKGRAYGDPEDYDEIWEPERGNYYKIIQDTTNMMKNL